MPPRTHAAGKLRAHNEGEEVVLAGWLLQGRKLSRNHSFHLLRDSTGVVQLVVWSEELVQQLQTVPMESVVHVRGTVRCRPPGMFNRTQETGEVEIKVHSWTLLNAASTSLPFQPSEQHNLPNEEVRAKNRFLDLRRVDLTSNIRLRSRVAHKIRCHLHDQGELGTDAALHDV